MELEKTLGDEMFDDPAEAFAWLSQYEGRKAEIAQHLLKVAYTIEYKGEEGRTDADSAE